MTRLKKPVEIIVNNSDSEEIKLIISKLPATTCLKVLSLSGGGIGLNDPLKVEEITKLVSPYIGIMKDENLILLQTTALVDNHLDGEALLRALIEVLRYNTSFLGFSQHLSFTAWVQHKIKDLIPSNIKTQISSFLSSLQKN